MRYALYLFAFHLLPCFYAKVGIAINCTEIIAQETLICVLFEKSKLMKKIIAAGGVITNENDEILLIFRRGKWDLPKGKLDDGEDIETCALREVREETGLSDVAINYFIGITHHEYYEPRINEEVHKETHWYAMAAAPGQQLVPQTEEDIEEIEWVRTEILDIYLNNTYPNITDIIEKFLAK